MGILVPILGRVRRQARRILGMNRQREVVNAASSYAFDHDESYPESVATIGTSDVYWNWQEPMMLTGFRARSPRLHRSMNAYLGCYIEDARTIFCPSAPKEYTYLQETWEAGDSWDHPKTARKQDPVVGTYCFWWNYRGCLEGGGVFRGPSTPAVGRGESKLLVSDYFGYDHWRSRGAYLSCERFTGSRALPETWVGSSYWSSRECGDDDECLRRLRVKLQAGFVDGHVASYGTSEAVKMRVSITADGSIPYPDGVGPGRIYLPRSALAIRR